MKAQTVDTKPVPEASPADIAELNVKASRLSRLFTRYQMAEVARARYAARGNVLREVSAAAKARDLGERFDELYGEVSSLESLYRVSWDCRTGSYVPEKGVAKGASR